MNKPRIIDFPFEGEGLGTGEGGDKTSPVDPGSILFPNDKPEGEKPADDKDDKEGGDKDGEAKGEGDKGAGDWKEYVNDPNKTDAENAAAKAEHDKTKPGAKDDKSKDDPGSNVPEDGKYDLKMPDGIEVDQELLDAISPKFVAKKFTRSEAQEFVDEFTKVQQARAKQRGEDWANTVQGWVDSAKKDKDIGGDRWGSTVSSATRAIAKLGTPELKEYLDASGGGNHPELIRFMAKVGALIREDRPAGDGAGGSGGPADPAHRLFPNDVPKGA